MAKKDVNNEKKKNNFSKELKSEMKKVTWPTFKQLVGSTSAVISIVLIVAAVVFILDVCFENLNKFGVENLKSVVSDEAQETEGNQEEDISEEGIPLVTEDDINVVSDEEANGTDINNSVENTDGSEIDLTPEPTNVSTEEVVQ